jgi:hypothetical protein
MSWIDQFLAKLRVLSAGVPQPEAAALNIIGGTLTYDAALNANTLTIPTSIITPQVLASQFGFSTSASGPVNRQGLQWALNSACTQGVTNILGSGAVWANDYTGPTMSSVRAGGAGPPTVTLTGVPNPFTVLYVDIVAGGVGVAATFRCSTDGGINFGTTQNVAATYLVPGTGVTIHFDTGGTYNADNFYWSPYVAGEQLALIVGKLKTVLVRFLAGDNASATTAAARINAAVLAAGDATNVATNVGGQLNLFHPDGIAVDSSGGLGVPAPHLGLTIAVTGGAVEMPAGTFELDTGVSRPALVSLIGQGKTATTLQIADTGDGVGYYGPVNGSIVATGGFRYFQVLTTNVSNVGAGFVNVGGSTVRNVETQSYGFRYGRVMDQAEGHTEDHPTDKLTANGKVCCWIADAWAFTPGSIGQFANAIRIILPECSGGDVGVVVDGGIGVSVSGGLFNSQAIYGIYVAGASPFNLGGDVCYLESPTINGAAFRGAAAQYERPFISSGGGVWSFRNFVATVTNGATTTGLVLDLTNASANRVMIDDGYMSCRHIDGYCFKGQQYATKWHEGTNLFNNDIALLSAFFSADPAWYGGSPKGFGINKRVPLLPLDIGGGLALDVLNVIPASGAQDLDISGGGVGYSTIILTGAPGNVVYNGIKGHVNGQVLRVLNLTNKSVTLKNAGTPGAGATAIYTPDGTDLVLAAKAGTLYNAVELTSWDVVGGGQWFVLHNVP